MFYKSSKKLKKSGFQASNSLKTENSKQSFLLFLTSLKLEHMIFEFFSRFAKFYLGSSGAWARACELEVEDRITTVGIVSGAFFQVLDEMLVSSLRVFIMVIASDANLKRVK